MTASKNAAAFPGYIVDTWTIDADHSDVTFIVRHMMVSKVRSQFTNFEGEIVTAEDPPRSTVVATIDLNSVNTRNAKRDIHMRSEDFLDIVTYPTMTYRSTGISETGAGWLLNGEFDLHGVTRPVPLELEFNGSTPDT